MSSPLQGGVTGRCPSLQPNRVRHRTKNGRLDRTSKTPLQLPLAPPPNRALRSEKRAATIARMIPSNAATAGQDHRRRDIPNPAI
jgi:hypothetical protein